MQIVIVIIIIIISIISIISISVISIISIIIITSIIITMIINIIKGTEASTSVDSSVPLSHHDLRDLGLICLVKKHKIHLRILLDLRIQS